MPTPIASNPMLRWGRPPLGPREPTFALSSSPLYPNIERCISSLAKWTRYVLGASRQSEPRSQAPFLQVLLHNVGTLAQKRLARGVRLNLTEATALLASVLQELIRDGNHSVAELMALGECSVAWG